MRPLKDEDGYGLLYMFFFSTHKLTIKNLLSKLNFEITIMITSVCNFLFRLTEQEI